MAPPPSSADGANAAASTTNSADRERRPAGPAAAAVLWRSFLRNTIYDVLRARPGWREAEPDGPWDFVWADKGWIAHDLDKVRLSDRQRVNHYPNHGELTRKDLLARNIKRARRALAREGRAEEAAAYSFLPETYTLPAEQHLLADALRRAAAEAAAAAAATAAAGAGTTAGTAAAEAAAGTDGSARSSGATTSTSSSGSAGHPPIWIAKPVGGAQGRGIFLFNRLSQISELRRDVRGICSGGGIGGGAASTAAGSPRRPDGGGGGAANTPPAAAQGAGAPPAAQQQQQQPQQPEAYLAQRYIEDPYLVGGRKFDLRIYAAVMSYAPLRVYLYRGGFARFAGARFTLRRAALADSFVHLTNVAVQRKAPGYDKAGGGGKWSLRSLRLYLEGKHGHDAAEGALCAIQALVVRTLLAVQPAVIHDRHCFELYGYDVLLDSKLKPWLLEVNASPSLSASDAADWRLKFGMLNDLLDLVDVEGRRAPSAPPPVSQGGFDLVWDGGSTASGSGNGSTASGNGSGSHRGAAAQQQPTAAAAAAAAAAAQRAWPTMLGRLNPSDPAHARRSLADALRDDADAEAGRSGGGKGGKGARAHGSNA